MCGTIRATLILFILIFTGSVVSRANEQKIFKLLDSSSVFIVREKRGQSDSARLVSDIVEAYTGDGRCIDVGLEISSEEQKNLDNFMRGDSDLSSIRINTFVIHKEYNNMMRNLI